MGPVAGDLVLAAAIVLAGALRLRMPWAVARRPALVARHRARVEGGGMVGLEVLVRKEDVALVRGVVGALADPRGEATARALRSSM